MKRHTEPYNAIVATIDEIEIARKNYQSELERFREARNDVYIAPEIKEILIPNLEKIIEASIQREEYLKLILSNQPITNEEADHLLLCPIIKEKFEHIIRQSVDDGERNTYGP